MLQGRRQPLVEHRPTPHRAANAVGGSLGGGAGRAAILMDHHHGAVGSVGGPRQPHQLVPVVHHGNRRRIGQRRGAGGGRIGRLVILGATGSVQFVHRHMIYRSGRQAGHGFAAAAAEVDHKVPGAHFRPGLEHGVRRISGSIRRIGIHRARFLHQHNGIGAVAPGPTHREAVFLNGRERHPGRILGRLVVKGRVER